MVDGIAPGLCPDHAEMDPQNALENASHAMKLAEDWLGVPMVSEGGRRELVRERRVCVCVCVHIIIYTMFYIKEANLYSSNENLVFSSLFLPLTLFVRGSYSVSVFIQLFLFFPSQL